MVKTAVTIHMAIVQDIISFDFRRKLSKEIDGVIGSKGNMERTTSQLIVRLLCVQSILKRRTSSENSVVAGI